jgi:hypothetical protein
MLSAYVIASVYNVGEWRRCPLSFGVSCKVHQSAGGSLVGSMCLACLLTGEPAAAVAAERARERGGMQGVRRQT